MKFNVIVTDNFERKVKRLSKKYSSLKADLKPIFDQLSNNPTFGKAIGNNCYKIRFSISSKGQGKSGGARMITYVRFVKNNVFLIDIYDKSEKESISETELIELISLIME